MEDSFVSWEGVGQRMSNPLCHIDGMITLRPSEVGDGKRGWDGLKEQHRGAIGLGAKIGGNLAWKNGRFGWKFYGCERLTGNGFCRMIIVSLNEIFEYLKYLRSGCILQDFRVYGCRVSAGLKVVLNVEKTGMWQLAALNGSKQH